LGSGKDFANDLDIERKRFGVSCEDRPEVVGGQWVSSLSQWVFGGTVAAGHW